MGRDCSSLCPVCIVQYRVAVPLHVPHLPNDGIVTVFAFGQEFYSFMLQ